jgi:hypothetical protein
MFLLGFAAGVKGPPWIHFLRMRFSNETAADRAETSLNRFSRQFGLSDDQRSKAREIISRQRERLDEVRREVDPRVKGIVGEARDAMREILRPEQQEHFDEVNRRMDEHRREMERMGPPPGNPMGPPPPPPPGSW